MEYNYELLTIEETMKILRIESKTSMYKLIHNEGFPALKIGNQYRVNSKELDAWIKNATYWLSKHRKAK